MTCQGPLGGRRGGDRVHGRPKHREEGVALRPDVDAVMVADGLAQDPVMLLEHVGPSRSERPGQVGRPLDVSEQERDGPRGQFRHSTSSAAW
jgi:hypothetical protein